MTTLFSSLVEKNKSEAVERLIADSTPHDDFFLLIVLSVTMATFGLLIDDAGVIIGSMLIAPLLSPILGVAMGVVMADRALISRSFMTVGRSILFAIPTAAAVSLLFAPVAGLGPELNAQIAARLEPNIFSALIAVVAGSAAAYALIKPHLSAALPGVAVAASLIPPLAVTGLGIARFDGDMIAHAFVIFLLNAGCIIFAGSVIFSLMRLYTKQSVAERAMKREDDQLRKEKEDAERA